MYRGPAHSPIASQKLSEVLDNIGVNKRMVLKWRRNNLLRGIIWTSTHRLLHSDTSVYYYGSQSEGSTVLGLGSDIDVLFCSNIHNVIQDWSEWKPGRQNLLMIQDETTSPGYCLLQRLIDNEPLPLPIFLFERKPNSNLTVSRGMVLLKNTSLKGGVVAGEVINGPAASKQGEPGCSDQDFVQAVHCKSWPVEAQPWLVRQGTGRWPTEEMKRYCETTGCFLVPVSSKSGLYEDLEWRISTSKAERCLMFSLNITQLRCYILMKMILKIFINPHCDGVISSFMCKTVLFHCIHNTHWSNWQPSNILACLTYCLTLLQNFVRQENCPHFIIPENNLMAFRRVSTHKLKICEILQNIIESEGRALLQIPIDDLGRRIQMKMGMVEGFQYYETAAHMHGLISANLLRNVATAITHCHKILLKEIMHDENDMVRERLTEFTITLAGIYNKMCLSSLEKSAFKLLTLPLSSSLGSVIASHDIYTTHNISPEAMAWFSVGSNSDVASGRLKLASALYCIGDMERAEFVLRNTVGKYDLNTVEQLCECYDRDKNDVIRLGFANECSTGNEEMIHHVTAFCVRFLRCEINCVPKELQYEMFRSTQEDMLHRTEEDFWMAWAAVEFLPYLFFLQYKTYRALQRVADQQCALENLARTIDTEQNLAHRETALNLLGQCMEQENRHMDALHCYMRSLNIRARNNAAKVLLCRLLCVLANMYKHLLQNSA